MDGDVPATVEVGAQRIETDLDGLGAHRTGTGKGELAEQGFDVWAETGARRSRREAAATTTDQGSFHRSGNGSTAPQRFTLGERALQPFDQLAPAGRGKAAQMGKVDRDADDLSRIRNPGRMAW